MKKPYWILISITCLFLCTLLGIFIGRNFTDSYKQIDDFPQNTTTATDEDSSTTKDNSVKIDLNTATLQQLQLLPGVGETTAQRIIDYRIQNNGFKNIEDLMNVNGIGEKKFTEIKPYIKIGENNENSGG